MLDGNLLSSNKFRLINYFPFHNVLVVNMRQQKIQVTKSSSPAFFGISERYITVYGSTSHVFADRSNCSSDTNSDDSDDSSFIIVPKYCYSIGVLGGISAHSTTRYLEKLVDLGSVAANMPSFIVCDDSFATRELLFKDKLLDDGVAATAFVEHMRFKRILLERSGVAGCIVMPCHTSHIWHAEISRGCSVPFLHVADCVARQLKAAKLRPIEAGSNVRIGVLVIGVPSEVSTLCYKDKLENQGLEVVLPDKTTREHIVNPIVESFRKKDLVGARNLLRIAVQLLLVKAVNLVIVASDDLDLQQVLPHDDPLLNKCIDPMDALARATLLHWPTK